MRANKRQTEDKKEREQSMCCGPRKKNRGRKGKVEEKEEGRKEESNIERKEEGKGKRKERRKKKEEKPKK